MLMVPHRKCFIDTEVIFLTTSYRKQKESWLFCNQYRINRLPLNMEKISSKGKKNKNRKNFDFLNFF